MTAKVANRAPILASTVVLGGAGLLAWRVRLAGLDDPARTLALALALGGALVASLVLPAPAEPRPWTARWIAVTGAGLGAIAAAAVLVGPRPPSPWAVAALPLSLLAAVAEEALFRRAMYGRLARYGPMLAVTVSATAFALLHVPAYGWTVFPVDLGAGVLLGWQRHAAGTWTAPALTHAAANVAAMFR